MAISRQGITIQQQVAQGNALAISNANINYHKVLAADGDKVVINFESLLTQYRYFLKKHIVILTLTDDQYLNYRFKPKSLSYDLYGTIEMASMLLSINNVVSVSEFDFKKVKVFDSGIKDFINEVLNKEKAKITANKSEVTTDLK
jgi:hypothetical protein